jgi:ATP-dependent protease ClpP protease subunit
MPVRSTLELRSGRMVIHPSWNGVQGVARDERVCQKQTFYSEK